MDQFSYFEVGLIALGIDALLAIVFWRVLWEKFKRLIGSKDD